MVKRKYSCLVQNCPSSSIEIFCLKKPSYHKIPHNPEIRKKWCDFLDKQCDDNTDKKWYTLSAYSKLFLCSFHFVPENFFNLKHFISGEDCYTRLKENSIPLLGVGEIDMSLWRDNSITLSNSNIGKDYILPETRTAVHFIEAESRTAFHFIEDVDQSKASEKSNDPLHSNPLFKNETIHQDIKSKSHISPLKNCESTSAVKNENINVSEKFTVDTQYFSSAEIKNEHHEIDIKDEAIVDDEANSEPNNLSSIDKQDLHIKDEVPPEIEDVKPDISLLQNYGVIMKPNNPIFMNQDAAFNDSKPSITVNDPKIPNDNNYKHGNEGCGLGWLEVKSKKGFSVKSYAPSALPLNVRNVASENKINSVATIKDRSSTVLTDNMEGMRQSNCALNSDDSSDEVSSDEEILESAWPFWKSNEASSLTSYRVYDHKFLKRLENTLDSYIWRKSSEQITAGLYHIFRCDIDNNNHPESPYDYFCKFFDKKIMADICNSTNVYFSRKNSGKNLFLSIDELKQWLGIAIAMSFSKFDDSRLYWIDNYCPNIRMTMSHNRWETIKENLNYVTLHSECGRSDKVRNVKLLINNLGPNFRKICPVSEHLYIREKIVYCKTEKFISKPKIGYRLLVLQDDEGMIHDFIIYMHKNSLQLCKRNPVFDFSQVIPKRKNHKLHCDERFTSVRMIDYLATMNIYVCGPIVSNDQTWKFRNGSDHTSSNRSYEVWETRDNHTYIVAYKCQWNNESKWFASSFEQSHSLVSESDRNGEMPNIVKVYKEHQNTVDRNEQTIEKYRMSLCANKYYSHLLFYLFDMAVVNSWLLYKRSQRQQPQSTEYSLCEFKMKLSESLMELNKNETKKRPREP